MSVTLQSRVVRHPDLVFAQMGDEVVMMSQDQNDYLGLNAVASVIWDKLEQPRQVGDVCKELLEQFEVTQDQCEADVVRFVEQMLERELVQLAS